MKRIIPFVVTCFFIVATIQISSAQSKESRFQQIETAKIAYITKSLDLSPSEAQKFFPLYNQYRSEMRNIMQQKKSASSGHSNFRAERPNELSFDSQVLECKKKYREKFSGAIPASKAIRFFEVEREFRESLFKELKSRNRN